MATSLRIFKNNFPLIFNSALRNTSLNGNVCLNINRFIFTETSLGLIGYKNARQQMQQQFATVEHSFRQKMNEVIQNENGIVFTEDLKAMLHLVNKNPDDMNLIIEMMHKFNSQNKELRFGTYVFGPVVMRAFYYLDDPDVALKTFLDSKLTYFFDQSMSYTILLTLLYNHQKYKDLRTVYEVIKARNIDIQRFPRNALIVVASGCYKENTPEALEYALESWKELNNRGILPIRRVITAIAALAIKQDSPEIALEILTGVKGSRYIDNRCLKAIAYCKLNRLADVVPILRQSLHVRNSNKEYYFSDVIETIEKSAETADEEVQMEVKRLIATLKEEGQVEEFTLEAHLLKPIERSLTGNMRDRRDNSKNNYNLTGSQNRRKLVLKDLL